MKKIFFVLMFGIFLIFLFQTLIVSAPATSDNYSVDYHTGISGGDSSNSDANSEFAFMYQGTGSAGNSDYSVNIGIFPQPLFCVMVFVIVMKIVIPVQIVLVLLDILVRVEYVL